jgi:CubicO group peptidase (beta-lactamase class C family)
MRNDDVLKAWVKRWPGVSNTERRFRAVAYMLGQPPASTPGTEYAYTNDAYLLLGNICERVTGTAFEDLVQKLVGELGLPPFGFTEPWSDGTLDQPWGHVRRSGRFRPYDADPTGYGGVPFGTPYGAGVNTTVVALADYGAFHLRGDLGLSTGLNSASFRRLHHAAVSNVARATQVPAAGFFNEGRVDEDGRWTNVQHWGYYARGRTLLWFSPQANVGAVVLTNGTDEDEAAGMRPISEIVIALFAKYRSPRP